jgi:acyl carrier protein
LRDLGKRIPTDEVDLIDGGFLDSLSLVELLFRIEREFDVVIAFDDLDVESLRNVTAIAAFADAQVAARDQRVA